ncbi:MAG: hypothetical protein R3D58_02675 [Saprospiraceae bacterium]
MTCADSSLSATPQTCDADLDDCCRCSIPNPNMVGAGQYIVTAVSLSGLYGNG